MLKVAVREPLQSKLERPEDWWQVCVNLCVCQSGDRERETTAVGLLGADVEDLCKLLIAEESHYI